MTFITSRQHPITRLPGVVFNDSTRPDSVTAAVVAAGLDYEIDFGDDGYKYNGKFHGSDNRRILKVKDGEILDDLGSAGKDWSPLQNLEIASYFEKVATRYPLAGIGTLKNSGMWIAFKGGNFDVVANGKRDEQVHTIMFSDWKRPGIATRLVDSPTTLFCQNQKYWIMSHVNVAMVIEHTNGNKTIVEYGTELLAGIAGRQTAMQQALQNMADFKLTARQVTAARDIAYKMPGKPSLSQFSVDTTEAGALEGSAAELAKLATFAPMQVRIENQDKGRENKVKNAQGQRDAFDESFDILAVKYGRTAYSVMEAISETNLWRENGKGDVVTDTMNGTGDRYHSMKRAGDYLSRLLVKN